LARVKGGAAGLSVNDEGSLMIRLLTIATAAAALGFAGCGDDESSSEGESSGGGLYGSGAAAEETTEAATTVAEPKGTAIELGDSQFGRILFGPNEQAIYLFDKEGGSKAECYGACAEAWPPVLTKGEPQATAGLKASLLGTTERDDGTTQVTYNGHPLYYYAHEGPGEVTCHDVEEFGGLWLVVDPAGDPV
jgi:predicted lipoprotein with Yx(FWY)xxD motif